MSELLIRWWMSECNEQYIERNVVKWSNVMNASEWNVINERKWVNEVKCNETYVKWNETERNER